MKKGKMYLSQRLHKTPVVSVRDVFGDYVETPMKLPNGCEGIMFVFRTKTAAREWDGKKTTLRELEVDQTG